MAEKILLIDDDLDTLRLVGLMLQRQGYQILAANNGPQALNMAEKEQPELILLDVMMPEMDGYEVARRLRTNPRTVNIPIIMFSAKSQTDDKVLGFEAGADDYLTKPTQPRELFAHMKAVLARTKNIPIEVVPPVEPAKEHCSVTGVIATKGGLGVTTIALNLGIAIRQKSNSDVIIADLRPGQGTIGLQLGYPHPDGLNTLLMRKSADITPSDIEKELVFLPSGVKLLLSSHHPLDSKYLQRTDNLQTIVEHLSRMTRYLILDLGNSLYPFVEIILHLVEQFMIVVEPFPHTLIQTKSLIEDLSSLGINEGRMTFVMINKTPSSNQLTINQAQEQLGHKITVGFTPVPELALQASLNHTPIFLQQPSSLTTQQFTQLAEKTIQFFGHAE
jgi:CheY-like chemotaxis protein